MNPAPTTVAPFEPWPERRGAAADEMRRLLLADTVWRRWSPDQWRRQGMAPLLGWMVTHEIASARDAVTVQRAYLLSCSMQAEWDRLTRHLLAHAQRMRSPFLVLKGQALAHALYPHPAARARSDLDIFIAESDRSLWESALQAMGFQPVVSRQGRWVSFQNTYVRPLPGGRRVLVDLHWQINNRVAFHRQLPFPRVYSRASGFFIDQACVPTLSPADALQLAVFHYYAHRPEDRKHLWLYDMALLWSLVAGGGQPHALLPAMRGLFEQARKELCAVFPGEAFAPVLPAVHAGDDFLPYSGVRRHKWGDAVRRWRELPDWRARWGLLGNYLFQSPLYVRRRFEIPENSWVWPYYPRMWWQDISRLWRRTRR